MSRQGQVAERFTRAIDQLGNDHRREVQIGGIYGLEQIAQQAPENRLAVTEVLVAYLHRQASKPQRMQLPHSNKDLRVHKPDVHAALIVLGRRKFEPTDPRLDLGLLDLRRADLRRANLCLADLRDTSLRRASLRGASLKGALVNGADLRDVDLTGVDLTGADLTGANLTGAAADQRTKWPDGFDRQGADVRSEPISTCP